MCWSGATFHSSDREQLIVPTAVPTKARIVLSKLGQVPPLLLLRSVAEIRAGTSDPRSNEEIALTGETIVTPENAGQPAWRERCQHVDEDHKTILRRERRFSMRPRRSCSRRATRQSVLGRSPAGRGYPMPSTTTSRHGRFIRRAVPARCRSEPCATGGSACFATAALGILGSLDGPLERGSHDRVHRVGQSPQGHPVRDRRVVPHLPACATGCAGRRPIATPIPRGHRSPPRVRSRASSSPRMPSTSTSVTPRSSSSSNVHQNRGRATRGPIRHPRCSMPGTVLEPGHELFRHLTKYAVCPGPARRHERPGDMERAREW